MLLMLRRVLGIINTISKTVTVTPITNATGMIGGGSKTIMDAEGGIGIEDLIIITINIIRLGIPTDHTMIDRIMIGHTITVPPGGGCLTAKRE
jgi:hypothetical protein